MSSSRFPAVSRLILSVLWTVPLFGAEGELPAEASALVFEFEVLQEKVFSEMPVDRLVNQYVDHLGGILATLQSSGNLDGALAVSEEIELARRGEVTEAGEKDPPELRQARSVYLKTRQEMEEKAREKILPLRQGLAKALENLKRDYTVKGKIEEAIAIKSYLDTFLVEAPEAEMVRSQPPGSGEGNADIRLQIDGRSYLCLRGDEMWYDHRGGAWTRPGLHEGIYPTYIDRKVEWMPVWKDKVTERYDAGLGIPVGVEDLDLSVRVSDGRAQVKVVQTPAKENDYTIKLELLDANEEGKGYGGSDWVRFRLSWKP